jgi:hypothetical protein
MSSQDPSRGTSRQAGLPGAAERDDAVATKLSKELNNWRRKRNSGRARRNDGERDGYQTASARTIKLKGHETLVVRKLKHLKPAPNQQQNPQNV